jgi:hypothetical protein
LGPLEEGGKALSEAAFEVEDDTLEISLVKDLLVLSSTQEEGTAAEIVDLAGDALGMVVDAGDEAVAEDWGLATGDAKVVLDVASGFFEIEGREVIADGDTLIESLEGSEAELVSEVRLAEEDEGEGRGRVHVVVEEETELVEEVRGEQVSLVDDEEDGVAFASEIGESGAELGEQAEEAESGLDLESEQDLAVESRDGEVGVGEIDDVIEVVIEGVSEGAEGGGLAGTDVAGDEGREAFLEGKGETALDFAVTAGREEMLRGDGLGER